MLKIRYEYRFLLLIAMLVILVGISGYQIYSRISGFVEDVRVKIQPDEKVLLLQRIKNDLVSAENSAYNFTLTEDEKILDEYNTIQESVKIKLEDLKKLSAKSKIYARSTLYMTELVDQKFAIMDTILVIQDNYRVNRAFTKMLTVINEKPSTTTEVKEEPKKEGVFRKLFSKRKESSEPVITEEKVDKDELTRDISLIKKEESIKEISSNEKLLTLKEQDTRITQTINNLMSYLQHQSQIEMEQINENAKKEARQTNTIVAIFVIVAIIMLGFVFYVVYDYIQYSRKYNRLLMQSKKESDEMAEAKSKFLAMMSHEIRTPMNAILGFSDLLIQSKIEEEQKKKARIIHNSAEFLVRLINDTLELSKLEAGKVKLDLEPTDIRALITETTDIFENLSKANNNKLVVNINKDVHQYYMIDPYRFKQIMINLLGNANKFTQNGSINLTVSLSGTTNVHFTVSDTGIGMTPEQQTKIFDEYEQANQKIEKEFGGSGLGLPITKKIIEELFHGSISVKSELNVGSEFTIDLPLQTTEEKPEQKTNPIKEIPLSTILKGKKILVADDEIFNRKLVSNILEKHGCKIELVENGKEALERVSSKDFDLILMDIHMPEMDGLSFIKSFIKSETTNHETPIMALTAFSENVDFYLNLGFSDLLRKPFNESELIERMEILVNDTSDKILEKEDHTVDLKSFRQLFEDNESFYKEMLTTFISSTKKGIEEIHESIDRNDYISVKEIAHRIASPCNQIHANSLYNLLKDIESSQSTISGKEEWNNIKYKLSTISEYIFEQVQLEINEIDANE